MLSLSENLNAVSLAEDIIWRRLPSNTAVVKDLNEKRLRNITSLPEMHALLAMLGHQASDLNRLNIIHVAGSKGKGSTAAFAENILRSHGLRTALFVSPHLIHPRERLRLCGRSLSLEDFSRAVIRTYERLSSKSIELPGLFRFLTLMAFDRMLAEHAAGKLDVAIIEVGMGGRYDSTNVIERPIVTVITSLSMEHVVSLGPKLADIAHHKVGIAKPGVPLFTAPQPPEASTTILKYCRLLGSMVSFVESLEMELPEVGHPNLVLPRPNIYFKRVLGIEGDHQQLNAALAVRAVRSWFNTVYPESTLAYRCMDPLLTKAALESTRWPGRHQVVKDSTNPKRTWYIDGAHTLESIRYAAHWFHKAAEMEQQRILIFHVSHDRSYEALLAPLLSLHQSKAFSGAYFVKPASPTDPPDAHLQLELHRNMAQYWTCMTGCPAYPMAARDVMSELPVPERAQHILVTGSLYIVGQVLELLNISLD